MKLKTTDNKMNTWFSCLLVIFILSACNEDRKTKNTTEAVKAAYAAPVRVMLDTAPPAKRVELKNAPPPQVVQVPVIAGGYHIIQTEAGEEKIQLRPPTIIKTKMPQADFTNYNTAQGLASDVIYDGLMDSKGRLWFSTGSYVSRYEPAGNGSSFSTFKVGQGSPIINILEDKKGDFWFGTWGGGIYRYDGITFTQFTTNEGLANNMVTSIAEDKKGNLWFSTYGGGASRYDGEIFTTFNTSNGLASNLVNWIEEDKSGNLWFAHYAGGVSRYDASLNDTVGQGSRFTTFTTEQGLAHNNVFSILKDKSGVLWFGTQEGVSRYDGTNFTTLKTGNGLLSNNVNAIAEDKRGNLWFATIGGGVCRYDGNRFAIFTTEQGLAHNKVWNITEDKNGNLWFGTDGGGLSRYNGKTINSFTASQGLVKARVLNITEDTNGNLWFGTYAEGVSRYDGKEFTNYSTAQGLPDVVVGMLTQDKSGNIWFGSNGGVSRYDGTSFTTFTTRQGLVHNSSNCIFEDKNGHLWFGTNDGLSRYDEKSFTSFTILQGLVNNFITAIAEGVDGDLWFGTEGGGVSRFNGKSFINYTVAQGLAGNLIKSIIKDSGGNLWFATSGGISRFDGLGFLSFNTSQGLADDVVSSIAEDNDGTIWFGTDKGLCGLKFNTAAPGNKPGQIKGAGLLKESNEVLKSYEPVWEIYHSKTGYPVKDFVERAICVKKLGFPFGDGNDAGMIWGACSDEKIIQVDPKAVVRNNEKPVAFFQSIKINETAINWYSLGNKERDSIVVSQQEAMVYGKQLVEKVRDSLQRKFRNIQFDSITPFNQLPQHLVLPYEHNRVTIDFGAIETGRNFMVRYQYTLEGYEDEWSPVTEKSTASYGNISEGSYTFKLKARSPEGIWGDTIEYKFRVLPPWFRTWWAYLAYLILFSLLIYTVLRWRTKSLKQDKIKLEEKVNQRTSQLAHKSAALEKSLENLKSTQSQLIQSEKMASLGELTAGIAHEIQNPLNFVNNFSEVNKELLVEMKDEIDKGNLDEVRAIANDVIENEEKINHHGKRADSIVKGMLQHSRSSSGVKEPTNINALADEYLRLSYNGLRAKDKSFNATLKTDFDESIGKINVVPQDIGRVILNLINNAFYAAQLHPPEKTGSVMLDPNYLHTPTVWLSTKKIGDQVLISVKDNGPGIPQKILDKIFQPFFTTKPTGMGTGLGLSMSYDIVTKGHGGELKVETKEGEGAEFIIFLPYKS